MSKLDRHDLTFEEVRIAVESGQIPVANDGDDGACLDTFVEAVEALDVKAVAKLFEETSGNAGVDGFAAFFDMVQPSGTEDDMLDSECVLFGLPSSRCAVSVASVDRFKSSFSFPHEVLRSACNHATSKILHSIITEVGRWRFSGSSPTEDPMELDVIVEDGIRRGSSESPPLITQCGKGKPLMVSIDSVRTSRTAANLPTPSWNANGADMMQGIPFTLRRGRQLERESD